MTTEYLVAFGGPVLVCLVAFAIGLFLTRRTAPSSPRPRSTLEALADAEHSVRLAADSIARVREEFGARRQTES